VIVIVIVWSKGALEEWMQIISWSWMNTWVRIPLHVQVQRKCLIKYPLFATFSKLYAEFCKKKKIASMVSPLSKDMFVPFQSFSKLYADMTSRTSPVSERDNCFWWFKSSSSSSFELGALCKRVAFLWLQVEIISLKHGFVCRRDSTPPASFFRSVTWEEIE